MSSGREGCLGVRSSDVSLVAPNRHSLRRQPGRLPPNDVRVRDSGDRVGVKGMWPNYLSGYGGRME